MNETPAGSATDELLRQISSDSGKRWERLTAGLALAIVDASLSANTPTLERLQRQLRSAHGQLARSEVPEAAERRGALVALTHMARLGATRAAATEAVETVEPDSLTHRMLYEIVEYAPVTSGELGGILLKDKYTVSRTGRKLIEHGLARKHAVGRQRAWEATRRGAGVIEQLGPPRAQPAPATVVTPGEGEDGLRLYLRSIGQVRPLTPEDEIELAKRAERGDAGARSELVTAHLRFVVSIAERYAGRGRTFNELIEEGNRGLALAVDRFNWRRGRRLYQWATPWIIHAIRRVLPERGDAPAKAVKQVGYVRSVKHKAGLVPEEVHTSLEFVRDTPVAPASSGRARDFESLVEGAFARRAKRGVYYYNLSDEDLSEGVDLGFAEEDLLDEALEAFEIDEQ